MFKYFKESFGGYAYADVIQTAVLLFFILFFLTMAYFIWKRPNDSYDEAANLPLDED